MHSSWSGALLRERCSPLRRCESTALAIPPHPYKAGTLTRMTKIHGARERARGEITTAIKQEARRQLAAEGAAKLSLRAVARRLGMVSSALYRYFPGRDDLLTALEVAVESRGDHAESAG